ncbi:hypothetical protein ACEUZ9_002821 [Paracoccus litorisediminis]|uniref:hypothetical protein n=1 Tax=Paracoccus litorisediminis TaxID=2006130 RepID=UPI0037336DDC
MEFEITKRSYRLEIADRDRFLDLLDSESHISGDAGFEPGARTLSAKLDELPGVSGCDYGGHFGQAIYLDIEDEFDTDALKARIGEVIEAHLAWCTSLPKDPRFVGERGGVAADVGSDPSGP